jgi:hypothetical protein
MALDGWHTDFELPDDSVIGSIWRRRKPQGTGLDRVVVSSIAFEPTGPEVILTTLDGSGWPSGQFIDRWTHDGKHERVETRIYARSATVESFTRAYTQEGADSDAALDRANESLREISEKLAKLEAK